MYIKNRKPENALINGIARLQLTSIKLIEHTIKLSNQDYGQKVSFSRQNIVGMTLLHTLHALTNSKGSRLCAVDGWIAKRYEYLGSLFSQMSS